MNQIFCFFLTVLVSSGAAYGQGFTGGSDLEGRSARGTIYLTCYGSGGEMASSTINCRQALLIPYDRDFFIDSNAPENTTHVELINEHQDGRVVSKRVRFDAEKGESRSRINLWIWSLTQRPLLDFGPNEVTYKYYQRSTLLREGVFEVNVAEGGSYRCDPSYESSSWMDDCRSSGQNRCLSYFRQRNWCQ